MAGDKDYDAILREHLLEEMERRKRQGDPEYTASKAASNRAAAEARSDNALASSLMKSAAQIGSYRGKVADTSAVDDMSKSLDGANTDFMKGMEQEEQGRDARYGMDTKVYQYLSEKKRQGEQDEATAKHRGKVIGETTRLNDAKIAELERRGRGDGSGGAPTASWSVASVPGADGSPIMINSKTGDTKPVPGASAKTKPATGDQFKAAGFARRLEQSEAVFADLDTMGYDRTSMTGAAFNAVVPKAFESGGYKTNEQAERNFINAVLRRESGAAISPTEFANAEQQYFSRPGDPPNLKAQKKANRQQVLETLRAESGEAYAQVPAIEAVATRKSEGTALAAPAPASPDEDAAALQWAQDNPNDPRAAAILKANEKK